MKFFEKLVVLRKKNNMSQEALASKLGVSRQAVSKWESGLSIPDMEKMMHMCKVFDCNLEDLVDDGITSSNRTRKMEFNFSWREYYQEILQFIIKTINMFWSMRLIDKFKCLLEMFVLVFLLFFIWAILGEFVSSSFYSILSLFPNIMYQIIYTLFSFVYRIFGLVTGFVILIHVFKIRYLDYFITVEDCDVVSKSIEVPIEEELNKMEEPRCFISKKKNTIVIRDPKHSTYGFFSILARMVVWFIKFLLVMIVIPCVICFVLFAFLGSCCLWYLRDGIFFMGIFVLVIGAILINYLVLKVIYNFVVELKIPFKKIFIVFIIGLVLMGFGGSISFCNYLTFDLDKNGLDNTVLDVSMEDDLVFSFMKEDFVSVVYDDSLDDVKVMVKHFPSFDVDLSRYRNCLDINLIYKDNYNFFSELEYLLSSIRDKKQIIFDDYYGYDVVITASADNISKLEDNYYEVYR